MSPRRAGALAVASALAVAVYWFARRQAPTPSTVAEATLVVVVTEHDAFGVPSKPFTIRDQRRVRAVLESIGADIQPRVRCPPDYTTANVGLLLTGADVYARRNAYLWDVGGAAHVVIVDETGCRGGAVPDAERMRAELERRGPP